MSLKRDYRGHAKCRVGPGGIGCPCCNPFNCNPRRSKPLMRRQLRRTTRNAWKREDDSV